MKKIKELFIKLFNQYKEIILYLVFGVMTTLVGLGVKIAILAVWKAIFNIPSDDSGSATYLTGAYIAEIVKWIAAVLFAFFTNRKWVFADADKSASVPLQLAKFAGGRVTTGLIEIIFTPLCTVAIGVGIPATVGISLPVIKLNLAEFIATAGIAVIVIIGNYIFSKLLVFKNKK